MEMYVAGSVRGGPRRILHTPLDSWFKLLLELRYVLIDYVWIVLQVERDVFGITREENHMLAQGMSVSCLVKYIRVPTTHFGYDDICFGNLIVDTVQDAVREDLFVDSLAKRPGRFTGRLDTKLIGIIEVVVKWHQYEYERFWARAHAVTLSFFQDKSLYHVSVMYCAEEPLNEQEKRLTYLA